MKKNFDLCKNLILTFKFFLIVLILIEISNPVAFSKSNGEDSSKYIESKYSGVIRQTFEELKIPGVIIGIWKGGLEPYITTLGVSDIVSNSPISVNDYVRIGSITKTFTGTVLLQLVDEGKLKLDDKLSGYFPEFPQSDKITIEMLGNMRSGIYNYSEDEDWQKEFMSDMKRSYTPRQLLDVALKHPLYFTPGTSMHYSNTNTVILGLIIEQLTGNKLKDEIKKRIFEPLGMTETIFAEDLYFPEPRSNGYMYKDSLSAVPENVTLLNPSWGWSAGAIISTLADIHKYAKPLAEGRLISKNSQTARLKWDTEMKVTSGEWKDMLMKYGFCIADFGGALGHNGGIPGFNSFMGYIPEKDITIIIFANMQENKEGIGPADHLARKIIETE